LSDLREEEFALTYCMKGMTWTCLQNMLGVEREWHLARLYKQLKKEQEESKQAARRAKRGK
jgi:hypothetical protein